MLLRNLFMTLCLGASLTLTSALPANARELKVGVGLPPTHAAQFGMEAFAKALKEKSGGELDVKLFSMSLLSLTQLFAGVRDGVVDAGFVLPPMFASELPESQLTVDLAMLGTNPYAMAGAMTEYTFSCQECLAERLKHNHVYLGSASSDPYWILSTKKIATLDDLKGKKLRSGAAPWARWAQNFGVIGMSMPGNEIFEAISQGTVDGAMISVTELSALRLIDVVKHVTVGLPGGTYHGVDNSNVNRTTWRSLTERQRRSMLDAAATTSAAITWKYVSNGASNMRDAQQKGLQIHQPAPDVMEKSRAFIETDLATVAQAAEKNYNIKNANQKIARFRQLVDKWDKLTPATRNWDVNSLAEIYQREVFSKIDAKSYGM